MGPQLQAFLCGPISPDLSTRCKAQNREKT